MLLFCNFRAHRHHLRALLTRASLGEGLSVCLIDVVDDRGHSGVVLCLFRRRLPLQWLLHRWSGRRRRHMRRLLLRMLLLLLRLRKVHRRLTHGRGVVLAAVVPVGVVAPVVAVIVVTVPTAPAAVVALVVVARISARPLWVLVGVVPCQ